MFEQEPNSSYPRMTYPVPSVIASVTGLPATIMRTLRLDEGRYKVRQFDCCVLNRLLYLFAHNDAFHGETVLVLAVEKSDSIM